MGYIILMILKIIGITLLVILGIILFLVLLILFVPVRYKVIGRKSDEIYGKLKFSWLLHLITVPVLYEKDSFSACVKIAGIKVKDFMESPGASAESITISETQEASREATEAPSKEPFKEPEPSGEEIPEQPEAVEIQEPKKTKKKVGLRGIFSEILEKLKKLQYTFKTFCDKIKEGIRKAGSVKEFLALQTTKDAMKSCLGQILYLLLKLKPRHIKGWIHFGMEDPALTGQILGAVSSVGGSIPRKLRLIPDFERQILELDVQAKGHLHVISAVRILIKLLLDKNVRTAYKKVKNGF